MADLVGQQFGNYRLVQLLGQGGFAQVYLAEHIHLETQAAVKVLSMQLTSDNVEHFRTEARTIARLVHPNVVRVLDYGVEGEGTIPYLVMDYAPNGSLRQFHPTRSQLPLDTIIDYVKQISAALHYAHEKKVIHRDIKPENMLLGEKQQVLLSDFGIALVTQSSRYENVQEIIGTVAYMAPEQLKGKPVRASDQYALGIVVYEWLCGSRPFHGSFTEIFGQQMLVPPPPLHEKRADVTPEVEEVVMTALAKDPQERFASILAFAIALEQSNQSTVRRIQVGNYGQPAFGDATEPTFISNGKTQSDEDNASTALPTSISSPVPVVEMVRTEQGPFEPPPITKRTISRRAAIMGLTGITVAAGGTLWFLQSHLIPGPIIHPTPTPFAKITTTPSVGITSTPKSSPTTIPSTPSPTTVTNVTPTTSPSTPVPNPTSPPLTPAPNPTNPPAPPPVSQGTTLLIYHGHTNWMTSVAWSSDNRYIASGSADKTAQVWDAATGNTLNIYRGHNDGVLTVSWSPNGQRIASGGGSLDKTAQVWDAMTGGNAFIFTGHTDMVDNVAWSPDGSRIASASWDTTVKVWDSGNGGNVFTYHGHTSIVAALAWSPNGQYIASGGNDMTVQVWEAATGNLIYIYRGHSDIIFKVGWSPDGNRIASSSHDHTAQAWDAMTGNNAIVYRGHTNEVNNVVWSRNNILVASCGADQTVQIWNSTNGSHLYTYTGHHNKINALSWSPDRTRIVSGDDSASVQVWQAM